MASESQAITRDRVGNLEVMTVGGPRCESRPPVLFIHGTGCGAWIWEEWLEVFGARGYRSYAFSFRGHGGSGGTYRDASVSDYLDDLRTVFGSIEPTPVLIGHSLGARMAQVLLHETLIPAAVFVAPTPLDGMPRAPAVVQFLRHPVAAMRTMRTRDMEPMFRAAGRVFFSPSVSESTLVSFERKICGEPLAIFMGEVARAVDVQLAPSTPTLLAAATFDPVSVARRRRDAEALGSDFVELRDVGHNVMVDVGSRAAASTVLDWLDSRLPAK